MRKPAEHTDIHKNSKYDTKFKDFAYTLCKQHGYTMPQLAEFFGVTVTTIYNWRHDHKEFVDAIKLGWDEHDSEKIERSLAEKATGKYTITEVTTEEIELRGTRHQGTTVSVPAVKTKTVVKEVAADVNAQMFYLCNRMPERWKHLSKILMQGDPKNPIQHEHGAKENSILRTPQQIMDDLSDPTRALEVAKILREAGVFDSIEHLQQGQA